MSVFRDLFASHRGKEELYPEIDRELWVDMLIGASAHGKLPAVATLLDRGLAVDDSNDAGCTPLMVAARNYRFELVRFLLARRADVNRRAVDGQTALHWAVMMPPGDLDAQKKCVLEILKKRPEVDSKDHSGCTPLMHASWFGLYPSVVVLLDAGANPRIQDSKGRTAQMLATERKHAEIAMLLSERENA